MERKLPKNIRQIGNVSDNPKVYVEDYVDTYLNQMCERALETPMGAFLIGESFRKDDQDYIFIHGAVQMQDVEMKGNEIVIGDKSWKKACEEGKRFFAGNTILGWFITAPGMQVKLNNNLIKLHERLFMRKSRMLMIKDSVEKEEAVFVYKYNDLMHIGGHYIYYEKNPSMQDYMIAKRKQNCVTPSESVEDRATKDFRSIINSKEKNKKNNNSNKYVHMASGILILIALIIGVVSVNGYEQLEAVELAMSNMLSAAGLTSGADIDDDIESVGSTNNIVATGNQVSVDGTLQEEWKDVLDDEILLEGENLQEEELEADSALESEELLEEDLQEEGESLENEDAQGGPEENVENISTDESASEQEAQGDEEVSTEHSIYVVKSGDSLAQICKDFYGTVAKVDEICELNNLTDEDYIYVGQQLYLLD